MKKEKNKTNASASTTIKRDRDTGEYIVRLFIKGVYQPNADYFADDKEDAIGTAKAMKEHVMKQMENKTYRTRQGDYNKRSLQYSKIVQWAFHRYKEGPNNMGHYEVTVNIGGAPSTYARIEQAAWKAYIEQS